MQISESKDTGESASRLYMMSATVTGCGTGSGTGGCVGRGEIRCRRLVRPHPVQRRLLGLGRVPRTHDNVGLTSL